MLAPLPPCIKRKGDYNDNVGEAALMLMMLASSTDNGLISLSSKLS